MIKLRNNPLDGSSVKLSLSFKDPLGVSFIPTELRYTVLALDLDQQSWSVVDGLYKVPLQPASSVALTVPNMKLTAETKPQRKIVVEYTAFLDKEYVDFVDEVEFEVEPLPTIKDVPPEPSATFYVSMLAVEVQNGSLFATPLEPVFEIRTSEPVSIENAAAYAGDVHCTIVADGTGTFIKVCPNVALPASADLQLKIFGLVSLSGDRCFPDNRLTINFTTGTGTSSIQELAEVTIRENESRVVDPEPGYDAIAKVIVNVQVPLEEKHYEVNMDGSHVIVPSSEFAGIRELSLVVTTKALYGYRAEESGQTFLFTKVLSEDATCKALCPDGQIRSLEVAIPDQHPVIEYEGQVLTLDRDELEDVER